MLRDSIAFRTLLCVVTALAFGACDPDVSSTTVNVEYDSTAQRVNVLLGRELSSGETLHSRVRRGEVGELNCANDSSAIDRIDAARTSAPDPTYQGPEMTPSQFESPYQGTEWFEGEPTAEMLEMIADGGLVIDVCWMDSSGSVVRQAAFDARRALDRRGQNGKFDGEEARIRSTVAYAERCEELLGPNPFFAPIEGSPGDYETYNCLDSTPIPTTVTDADGNVTYPSESVDQCDNPQQIYSSCEPSATNPGVNGPRVARRTNDQGTHVVLLCRKSHEEEGGYNDIAMIMANPFTGETCFFQNALYDQTDGLHVPHPGDTVNSDRSPQQSSSLWEGIHGGLGNGIQCTDCHDADPFIHSPWIDGAVDEDGDPIVPLMGVDPDWALGFNDQPYHLVNADGQGWTMHEQATAPEAAACTRCHRMTYEGRWGSSWMERQMGDDDSWNRLLTEHGAEFDQRVWMPPQSVDGLSEETFEESEFGQAIRFIQNCANNRSDAACTTAPIPTDTGDGGGSLPTVDLEGRELATAALIALGANIEDPSCEGGDCFTRRCSECHAVSPGGLDRWEEFTRHAWDTCGVSDGALDLEAAIVDLANMADLNTLDNDAGLRSDAAEAIVNGRPFSTLADIEAVDGVGGSSLQKLSDYATQAPQHISQEAAIRTIDCLRSDPSDGESVFAAENLGILTISVQYSYFRRLFQAAYGDNWLIEYTRFKNRVGMPKGSHPSFSQLEAATVIEWFRQGLPNLRDVLQEEPAPTTCEESFDTSLINAHLTNMEFDGWGAINADNNMRMHGCTAGADPATCFTTGDYPDRSAAWGNDYGTVRELHELGFRTSFWMRTSPDGRFVGNGGGEDGRRSTINDLAASPVRNIGVAAAYDPGFFPDNSGWMWQGARGGAAFCSNSVLEDDDDIDFSEDGCIQERGINLYQHVARGLNGGDYFIINSQFTSNGGRSESESPRAPWNETAEFKITPMISTGNSFESQDPVTIPSPHEGDAVLSPSGQLVAARLSGPESRSLGYSVRRVNTNRIGDQYTITLDPPMATFCTEGAKPNFSFDERFIVTHVHDGDEADLVLFDLMTGETRVITSMPDQTRALFPHFRSDGWIYFLVIDEQSGREYVGASDAAIIMAAG